MRPDGVVTTSPTLSDDLDLTQHIEDIAIERLNAAIFEIFTNIAGRECRRWVKIAIAVTARWSAFAKRRHELPWNWLIHDGNSD